MENIYLIGIILFFASFIQGIAGFGSAITAIALLTFFVPISFASPMMILSGLIMNSYIIYRLREAFDFRKFYPIFLGSLGGVPVGVFILVNIDESISLNILAAFIFVYSLYSLLIKKPYRLKSSRWGYFFGFISGCFGGAYSTNGPPLVVYTSMQNWDKDDIVITLQVYFLISAIVILIMQSLNGLITVDLLKIWSICIPFQLGGVILGNFFYFKINQKIFKVIIFSILLII